MAQMKHVVVCNTNINQLIQQISCKLGTIGFNQMISEKYGVSNNCDVDTYDYNELSAYLTILENLSTEEVSVEDKELGIYIDIGLVDKCSTDTNYELIIERIKDLLSSCIECRNYYDNSINITTNDTWYETQEYIDCLIHELEENGYIEYINPIVDLCTNLNINIDVNQLCNELVTKLSINKINCSLLTNINPTNICNTIYTNNLTNKITINSICDIITQDIQGTLPTCDIKINIDSKFVGCPIIPLCEEENACVSPLVTITDNSCVCTNNNLTEIEGIISVVNNCEDELLYNYNNEWTNIKPLYEDIDNILYYKCRCEENVHYAFKYYNICLGSTYTITKLCNHIDNNYYIVTYNIEGDYNNINFSDIVINSNGYVGWNNNNGIFVFYTAAIELNVSVEIPLYCGETIYLYDIFAGIFNMINYSEPNITYDCSTKEITITANNTYEISVDLISWQSSLTTTFTDTNFYYYIKINDAACILQKYYSTFCCTDYNCDDANISIVTTLSDIYIQNDSNCEYIIDFYVNNIKIYTTGSGIIYNATIENPFNLTLQQIKFMYCGDYANPVYIYPIIRAISCQNIVCYPNCSLTPIMNTCLNVCSIPSISAPTLEYNSNNNINFQYINYAIAQDTVLKIDYNMYIISDSIEVYYNGLLVNGNYDLINIGTYLVPIVYMANVNIVTIKFIPNSLFPTKAKITVSCMNYNCVENIDCLSLNVLDYESPVISLIDNGCYDSLLVTLPILQKGNLYYNNCINYYGLLQTNSISFDIGEKLECSIARTNYQYLCDINDFNSSDILVLNNQIELELIITNANLFTILKNYISSYSCNPNNNYNYILIELVNKDSTACNNDCTNDIDCNLYSTTPLLLYPCFDTIVYNDSINSIKISRNTIPDNASTNCGCIYENISPIIFNNNLSIFKTLDSLSYVNIFKNIITDYQTKTIVNSLDNNLFIENCNTAFEKYIITYTCSNNPINSVRIYKQNDINTMFSLVYQGNITWTDGRVVDSGNYIYTESTSQINECLC